MTQKMGLEKKIRELEDRRAGATREEAGRGMERRR